jgi:putative DNA primase/helicase
VNRDHTFAIATAPKRDSFHWKQDTVTWGELLAWMGTPGDRKEAGNYLLGTLRETTVASHDRNHPENRCTNLHRRKDAVVSRSAITLDIDSPPPGFADMVELVFPYSAIMHTTYSSSPDALRYRLIIPVDRELAPDEYITAAQAVMGMLGTEAFDPGSSQPERYMFRPASNEPSWFQWWEYEAPVLPVDEVLSGFELDLSAKPIPKPNKSKRDPYEIDGVIGAFNRAYEDWDLLIEVYDLPYTKVDEDRYQLVGARSEAGMGPIRDVAGFVYSHHANDPAYGKTCSAFDLVRLHQFGDLDEDAKPQTPVNKLPSQEAMLEVATTDHRVIAQLVGVDFSEELEDVVEENSWKVRLRLAPRSGKLLDVIQNWDLIRDNDPVFQTLSYNELTLSPEARADLPWRKINRLNRVFNDTDRWELTHYIEREYGIRPVKALIDSLVDTYAARRRFNPVHDYLEGLVWDGKARVETCLPGVRTTPFTRVVARKVMVAAVGRMLDPGCKWDHTLVLFGEEGKGKSWWVEKLAKGYSSSLGRIDNKDTLLTMQRSWIMMADEGHSLRKADSDAMKEFLTRTSDVFRMPYDRETLVHPRHSVIWSSTNDETFLRRQEGNRRFLIVHCEDRVNFDKITDEYVDQLWAEAVYMYRAGELLYLLDDEANQAAMERERFTEEDAIAGQIQEYLDQLVPAEWWSMSPESRVAWMADRDAGFHTGIAQVDRTCSRQLWKEALGQRFEPRRVDLLDITEALKRVPGWRQVGRTRIPGYGPQVTYVREDIL